MRKFLFWGLVGTGAILVWLYLEARRSHRRDAEEFDELFPDSLDDDESSDPDPPNS